MFISSVLGGGWLPSRLITQRSVHEQDNGCYSKDGLLTLAKDTRTYYDSLHPKERDIYIYLLSTS